MDTLQEYALMNEKILPALRPVVGQPLEFYHSGINIDAFGNFWYLKELRTEGNNGLTKIECEIIWLPRQDQLQEMVLDKYHFYALPTYFKLFCGNEEMYEGLYAKKGLGLANKFTSLEQFWLAFVVYEKYRKIWDGKNWIKED